MASPISATATRYAPLGSTPGSTLPGMRMSHAALRDATPATEAWQRVLREYPSSDAAGKARTLLGARLSRQP